VIPVLCAAFGVTCTPSQVAVLTELVEVSIEANQDPIFVAAVAYHESRWHADRVSKSGAQGPLGVLPVWLRRPICYVSGRDTAGKTLVDCGVRLLIQGVRICGQSRLLALGWYHTGTCRVDRYARVVFASYRRATRYLARKAVQ
jgi:hypothetical protein